MHKMPLLMDRNLHPVALCLRIAVKHPLQNTHHVKPSLQLFLHPLLLHLCLYDKPSRVTGIDNYLDFHATEELMHQWKIMIQGG